MDKAQVIRSYILEHLNNNPTIVELNNGDDLLQSGILDSLGVLQLVSFIETECLVKVLDADITLENFSSIRAIMEYVQRLHISEKV